MRTRTYFLIVLVALSSAAARVVRADGAGYEEDTLATLTVSGEAHFEVAPDELRLRLGVVTEGGEDDSTRDVVRDNSKLVEKVLRRLKDAGLDDDEIETSRFSITPIYTQRPARGEAPRIVGMRVENVLLVTTTKLDLASELIDRAVDSGANVVRSISFGLADERTHRARAIAEAAANARADAAALAAASGVELVRTIRVDLDQPHFQTPQPMMRGRLLSMETADAAISPSIMPGDVVVSATVSIVYEIEDTDG